MEELGIPSSISAWHLKENLKKGKLLYNKRKCFKYLLFLKETLVSKKEEGKEEGGVCRCFQARRLVSLRGRNTCKHMFLSAYKCFGDVIKLKK